MRLFAGVLFMLLVAGAFIPCVVAQTTEGPRFAEPVRLKAGDAFLGEGRSYPSPAMHDIDGDGVVDVVIGDLPGTISLARGVRKGGAYTLAAEKSVKMKDGNRLEFNNW